MSLKIELEFNYSYYILKLEFREHTFQKKLHIISSEIQSNIIFQKQFMKFEQNRIKRNTDNRFLKHLKFEHDFETFPNCNSN